VIVLGVALYFRDVQVQPSDAMDLSIQPTPVERILPILTGSGSGSGNDAGSCFSNPTPKATPEGINHGLGSAPKTKKQKGFEKMTRELKEFIEEEDKLKAERSKRGRGQEYVTVMIKDGRRLFAPDSQVQYKFHHALETDSPLPDTLSHAEVNRLSNSSRYEERLETFRNPEILPDAYVRHHARDLRLNVLHSDTKIIEGTLGANLEANGGPTRIEGYHAYNEVTGFSAFFEKYGNRYRTITQPNGGQKQNLKINKNIL
jgi:hypothetical protein